MHGREKAAAGEGKDDSGEKDSGVREGGKSRSDIWTFFFYIWKSGMKSLRAVARLENFAQLFFLLDSFSSLVWVFKDKNAFSFFCFGLHVRVSWPFRPEAAAAANQWRTRARCRPEQKVGAG